MAEPANPKIDDFLGGKVTPVWQRYAKWIAVGALVLVLLLTAWRYFGGEEDAGYSTRKVDRGALTVTVSATGKLAPTNQVTVGSQLSGLVTQVLVDVNDRVAKGQALAQIDPEQIEDQIRQNQAQLAANQASVEQSRATLADRIVETVRGMHPYDNPALFSVPLAFLVSICVSLADRSAAAQRVRAAFPAQHVRAQTGFALD